MQISAQKQGYRTGQAAMTVLRTGLLVSVLWGAAGHALLAQAENAPAASTSNSSSGVSGVAQKAENGVKRGAKATGNALERAGQATSRGINKAAQKMGLPAQPNKPAPAPSIQPG